MTVEPGTPRSSPQPAAERWVRIPAGGTQLEADLLMPAEARGLVIFAHGSGSSRHSTRNRHVAQVLLKAGMASLLLDLLTLGEAEDRRNVFDIPLLAERLRYATSWAAEQPELKDMPVGYFGASTGAGAALAAAAREPRVAAVVSRGGRPDLAGPDLALVRAPTLLVVGGWDEGVIQLNQLALQQLNGIKRLVIVPEATHLFEEPGKLEEAARHAAEWFSAYLDRGRQAELRKPGAEPPR